MLKIKINLLLILPHPLQPVNQTKLPLSELVLANVIHPDYRILKMRNVPYIANNCREFTTDTWKQLMKQINQMILTDSVMEEGYILFSTELSIIGNYRSRLEC